MPISITNNEAFRFPTEGYYDNSLDDEARFNAVSGLSDLWRRYRPVVRRGGVIEDTDSKIARLESLVEKAREVHDRLAAAYRSLADENSALNGRVAVAEQAAAQAAALAEDRKAKLIAAIMHRNRLETEAAALVLRFGPPDPPDDPTSTDATCTHKKIDWQWRPSDPPRWTVAPPAVVDEPEPEGD